MSVSKKTTRQLLTLSSLAAAFVVSGTAHADTFYSTTNARGISDATTIWNTVTDGSGSPVALPTSGDTNTWVYDEGSKNSDNDNNSSFLGGTLVLEGAGSTIFLETGTMNNVTFNGGRFEWRSNFDTTTLSGALTIASGGAQFTANGSGKNNARLKTDVIAGDGVAEINYADGRGLTLSQNTTTWDTSGFTGSFDVSNKRSGDDPGEKGFLAFESSVSGATFSINLIALPDGAGSRFGAFKFIDGVNVDLTEMNLIDNTGSLLHSFGAGTYAHSDVSASYGDYFITSGTGTGTFTIVPEPSSLALLGLGGLLIARRRR
ncbi:MAG: PEP-CTERM sorting domain-containing protein [Phycisphaeraceae bacterium]|nr:PEP-CTERM sorting domain-containing protein [Phycisphaeraceae bacterium]